MLALLATSGCAITAGRVDASAEGRTVHTGGGTCTSSHTEKKETIEPVYDATKGTSVWTHTTADTSVCDSYASDGGGRDYETGTTKFGAWFGMYLGYSSLDVKTMGATPTTTHTTGAAHDYELEAAIRRPGSWSLGVAGGYMSNGTDDVVKDSSIGGFTASIRAAFSTNLFDPYIGVGKVWSSLDVNDAPLYRIRAGFMRIIPFNDTVDLLPRFEFQYLTSSDSTNYDISGYSIVGSLGLTF
jgi:hypothetical protein